MKLGQLKAAIRGTKGNPYIETALTEGGPKIRLFLQKSSLLEELEVAYPGGKAVETGLLFNDGLIYGHTVAVDQVPDAVEDATFGSDDDLLV